MLFSLFFFRRSMPTAVFLLFFASIFHGPVLSAKILFTFFHDRGSHFGSMLPFMEKLSRQQHSVSLLYTIGPNPPSNLPPQLQPIVTQLPPDEDDLDLASFIWNRTVSVPVLFFVFSNGNMQLGRLMEWHPEKVVKLVEENWDLIVIDDLFWSFGFALSTLKQRLWEANRLGPEPRTVVYCTAGQSLLSADSVKSLGRNWVSKAPLFPYIPANSGDMFSPSLFTHRLFAFYENFAELVLMNWMVERFMLPNIAHFGVPNFSWYELYQRSSLQMTDSIDRLGWPLAQGTETINVGAHCKQTGELKEEFRRFMEQPNSKGTIYVAFGTYPEWKLAPARVIDSLIGAFQKLTDYRVIFVYNGPAITGLGKHIMLAKWAPQLEILAHPSMRAYITHGGLKSVREGLCAGVPLIIMPLFAEQAHQAHLLLKTGIGPVINKYTLTADSVYHTIHQVVSNPENIDRSRQFNSIFIDRPMPALDEGVFWIERLMRLKPGRRANFVRKGMQLSWLEFVYVDIALLLMSCIFIVANK